ncbi:hypothetical protein [Desulfomarina profundi]|nr:hypothetical protein [Desulfomarina profundi]
MKRQYGFVFFIFVMLHSSIPLPAFARADSKADIVLFFSNTVLGETEPCG